MVEEKRRNPDYELPDQFLEILVSVKPILDELWPRIEEHYRQFKRRSS